MVTPAGMAFKLSRMAPTEREDHMKRKMAEGLLKLAAAKNPEAFASGQNPLDAPMPEVEASAGRARGRGSSRNNGRVRSGVGDRHFQGISRNNNVRLPSPGQDRRDANWDRAIAERDRLATMDPNHKPGTPYSTGSLSPTGRKNRERYEQDRTSNLEAQTALRTEIATAMAAGREKAQVASQAKFSPEQTRMMELSRADAKFYEDQYGAAKEALAEAGFDAEKRKVAEADMKQAIADRQKSVDEEKAMITAFAQARTGAASGTGGGQSLRGSLEGKVYVKPGEGQGPDHLGSFTGAKTSMGYGDFAAIRDKGAEGMAAGGDREARMAELKAKVSPKGTAMIESAHGQPAATPPKQAAAPKPPAKPLAEQTPAETAGNVLRSGASKLKEAVIEKVSKPVKQVAEVAAKASVKAEKLATTKWKDLRGEGRSFTDKERMSPAESRVQVAKALSKETGTPTARSGSTKGTKKLLTAEDHIPRPALTLQGWANEAKENIANKVKTHISAGDDLEARKAFGKIWDDYSSGKISKERAEERGKEVKNKFRDLDTKRTNFRGMTEKALAPNATIFFNTLMAGIAGGGYEEEIRKTAASSKS